MAISGTVELNGKPLPEGNITFEPKDKDLRAEGADIRDGKYALTIMPGNYAVKIRATKKVPLEPGEPSVSGEKDKLVRIIPTQYNDKTTLNAAVSAAAPTHDFKLTSP